MAKLTKNTLVTLAELVDITGRTKQNVNKIAADGKITAKRFSELLELAKTWPIPKFPLTEKSPVC